MKFLLEFASCCRQIETSEVPTTPPRTEEKHSLMQLSCAERDRSPCPKRGRVTGSGSKSVSAVQWRPSLCAISEDNVVFVVAGKAERTVRSEKNVTGKARSKTTSRVRKHSDEFRCIVVKIGTTSKHVGSLKHQVGLVARHACTKSQAQAAIPAAASRSPYCSSSYSSTKFSSAYLLSQCLGSDLSSLYSSNPLIRGQFSPLTVSGQSEPHASAIFQSWEGHLSPLTCQRLM
ncbi:hypothetical protein HHK36_005535 [Tetracentron sinense]|uniref:Uncharacterized protein n=1 Tax=Tetracentron sinense TaxID=13715 RepID=A0A835DQS6_TETSI|nr:hypothetical protein HHK36_005535 [Tetracentron sinense]